MGGVLAAETELMQVEHPHEPTPDAGDGSNVIPPPPPLPPVTQHQPPVPPVQQVQPEQQVQQPHPQSYQHMPPPQPLHTTEFQQQPTAPYPQPGMHPQPGMYPQPGLPPLPIAAPRNPAGAAYIRAIFAPHGWTTLAWIAGAVLAAGVLSALCLLGALGVMGSESGGAFSLDFGSMLSALLVLIGASFGGGLVLEGNVGAGLFEASGNASATLFPLTALALIAAGTAIVARLRLRFDPAPAPSAAIELARAAIEGAAVALVLAIVSAFAVFGGSSAFGGMFIRTRPVVVFFTLLVVVTLSLFLSRESQRRRLIGRPSSPWTRALRESGGTLAVQGAVFSVCALVFLVILAVQAKSVGVLFASLPLLGNVAAIGAALGHFGGLAVGTSVGIGQTMMAWDIPGGHGVWLFVAALISLVIAAGVVGVRRQRTGRIDWRRVWQMPLIVFGVWCVLSLGLVGVTLSGELSSLSGMFGVGSLGLSWSTPFVMGLAAAALSIGAEFVPLWAYRMSPGLLRVLGGRQVADAWIRGTEPSVRQAPPLQPTPPAMQAQQPYVAQPHIAQPQVPFVEQQAPAAQPPFGVQQPNVEQAAPGFTAPGLAASDAAAPHIAPMSKGAKTGLLVGLSVVGLLAVVGGGLAITVGVLNQGRDPGAPVREYLGALEDGDAERASELVDPGLKTADRELLTNDTLAGATHRIEVVEVETMSRTDDGASVRATYALDGERFEQEFWVTAGAKELLFLDTWTLNEPLLVEAELSGESVETLAIGPTELTLSSADEAWGGAIFSRTAYLYPGIYEVTSPEDTYLSTSTEELRALPASVGEYSSITVTSKPSEAFEKAVLKQVQSRIAKCVEIPTNMDDVCPYETRNKDLAELKVVEQATGFEEISLDSFRSTEAELTVLPNPSTWNKDPDVDEVSVTVTGSIEFVNGKPKVSDLYMGW